MVVAHSAALSSLVQDAARALIYEEADVNKEDEKQRSPMALTTLFDCISKDKLLKMIDEGIAYRKRRHLEDPVTKAKITQAVALFNNKPKKGLQFLVDEKVIPDTTTDKAEFLLTNKKLDKVKIGEILGEPDETALLTAFVDLLEFRGMEVRGHPTDTHTEREREAERDILCVSLVHAWLPTVRPSASQVPELLPPAGRGAKDRPHDDGVRTTLPRAQLGQRVCERRRGVRSRLLDHHAQHRRAQPGDPQAKQDDQGAVHRQQSRHQRGRRPAGRLSVGAV